jgi:hypothetical protein
VTAGPIVGQNSIGIRLVCRSFPEFDQAFGVLEDRSLVRSRFLLRGLAAPILYFALVESHGRIVTGQTRSTLKALTVVVVVSQPSQAKPVIESDHARP